VCAENEIELQKKRRLR